MPAPPTAPRFLHGAAPALVCSILRSGGVEVVEAAWETGTEGMLPLWWGSSAWVKRGDRIRYFVTPAGIAFEAVEAAHAHP